MTDTAMVYKNFDQEALDLQYNVRAGIPDFESIFQRWRETSRSAVDNLKDRAHIDLKYGDDEAQSIDLFLTHESGRPLIVFIHGGYWQSLDKSYFNYLAETFVEDGFNFATLNYRLAPTVTMDEIVSDCREAIAWLGRHADRFGFDLGKIIVTGSSAGGHLTAMMLATDWSQYGLPGDLIAGGCALSGLYDLEPIRLCYLNGAIKLDAETARRNSPVRNVPQKAPPLILSFGGDETSEFSAQQTDLASLWQGQNLRCGIVHQDDGHHFDMVDRLGDRNSEIYKAVISLT